MIGIADFISFIHIIFIGSFFGKKDITKRNTESLARIYETIMRKKNVKPPNAIPVLVFYVCMYV